MAKDQKPADQWRRLAKTLWRKPIRLLTPISIFSRSPFHRLLKSLLGRRTCHLERIESIGKPRHINSDVV